MDRRLRLISGLILFFYLLTHLLNHALGLISLEALEVGRQIFTTFWRNLPISLLLYGALLLHAGLALWALFLRRSLVMAPWEATRTILGLALPPLLVLHILGTRLAQEVLGVDDSYNYILLIYFVFAPALGVKQVLVVLVAWLHGCIGLHFWARLQPWYRQAIPMAFAAALLLPVLSLLGVLAAGREIARLAGDPAWLAAEQARLNFADDAGVALIYDLESKALWVMAALLAMTLLARVLRAEIVRRRGIITITYPDNRKVSVSAGMTILEASRVAGIPHASVCGGRGRCSTCRVRVGEGLQALPPASSEELRVLARVKAAPTVRLACQTRPTADVTVTPLLPATATPRDAGPKPDYLQGQEREVAILFADLRGFTTLAENKLPYDVVFILNRYFTAMGTAIEAAGGRVDKFIGDGVMAVFGVQRGAEDGSRRAIDAARRMAEHLAEINSSLAHDLDQPLRIGIGIHSGPVIVGEMGYGAATSVTAIGDAVNTASRLEAMTKEFGAQLIVSAPAVRHAGIDLSTAPRHEIELRGRSGRLTVYVVDDARKLQTKLETVEKQTDIAAP